MVSLRIQFVLFETDPARFVTVVETAAESARLAIDTGVIGSAALAIGDCSPSPSLDSQGIASAEGAAAPLDCAYTFFDANLGSGGGSNELWRARREDSDLLLILNPDTMCSPTLIAELAGFMLQDPSIGIADARQIPMEHPKAFDPTTLDVSWASGACMMLRREAFEAVGLFAAEYFPLYCDDVDLSWRIRLQGYRCVHVPTAVVHHDKRPNLSGRPTASDLEQYWAALGGLLMATRWGRQDLAEDLEISLQKSDDAIQTRALADFLEMRRDGTLPESLPGGERVAEFMSGNYAEHRF